MAKDVFRCPHDECVLTSIEDCHPHTEEIGDQSEYVGRHCWEEHECVQPHPDAWEHTDDFDVDYRDLLKKYIDHVGTCEGATYIDGRPGYGHEFTEEEWTELERLEREVFPEG